MMISVSYLTKRKIKKIFLEVISNAKIFNIIFFSNEITNDQDFAKLTEDKTKGELDNVEYGSLILKATENNTNKINTVEITA